MTDDARQEPTDLVPFRIARTPFEARVIAAVLESAGIPTVLPDGMLADEFASSQRLMNLQNVRVLVPRARLAEAEEVLKEARRIGAELEPDAELVSEGEEPGETLAPVSAARPPKSRTGLAVLFAITTVVFFVSWLEERAPLGPIDSGSRIWGIRGTETTTECVRRDGTLANRSVDADRDGVLERQESFDRSGAIVTRSLDMDQNGDVERLEAFDRDGKLTSISIDDDGDGRFELIRQARTGGGEVVFLDTDGSQRFAVLEIRAPDGTVRVRQELDPERGFVTR